MNNGLVSALIEQNKNGDNAVDAVLAMAGSGDIAALKIVKSAIEHFGKKKFTYFTPGIRG